MTEPELMLTPEQLRHNYNSAMERLGDGYINFRWGNSPTKRRHYQQTRASLEYALSGCDLGRVLEVGCGPAVWTPMVLTPARALTLVDISDEMLEAARRALGDEPKVSYVRADFVTDPPSGPFDTVLSVRAFEYMPDKPGAMRRFAQALRPGGSLVLVTKSGGWRDHVAAQAAVAGCDPSQVPDQVRMQAGVIGWQALQTMAEAAGMQDVRVHPTVIGSYSPMSRTRPALWYFDWVHRRSYRRPMTPSLDALTESVTLVAKAPAA